MKIIRKFLFLTFLPLVVACVTQENVRVAEFVAHAGGGIEGHIYTNSREALELAKENGYKFIEFDLQMTSDSILVAAHSWGEFNRMTGADSCGNSAPAYSDFVSRRIHGKFTPLSAQEINDYFMADTSLYLVTDKISDPIVLGKYFPRLKERMVVEAFDYNDYIRLRDAGYFRVLYSCMASDMKEAVFKNLLFNSVFPGKRIEWIALHTDGLENGFFKFLNRTRRFKVALFTVDSLDSIPVKYRTRAEMIYTNTILPK